MAILSMTGFGKANGTWQDKKINIEIRSLNSKGADIHLRTPNFYREKEMELRTKLAQVLDRGKIDFSLNVELEREQNLVFNRTLFVQYYQEFKSLANELGESQSDLFLLVSRMPNVMMQEKEELHTEEWIFIENLVQNAIADLQAFRLQEGAVLARDMENRIQCIMTLLAEVAPHEAQRIVVVRERLQAQLQQHVSASVNAERLEQELVYYLDKFELSEEKTRLAAHCAYFLKTLHEEQAGRKLGFIAQEIGREINTLGSKANHLQIQQIVVQMKDELEKIKEQVLNIL
jgi:uncharacterized protein (TIGR00255 family)